MLETGINEITQGEDLVDTTSSWTQADLVDRYIFQ